MRWFKRSFTSGAVGILVANLILPIYPAWAKITPKDPKNSELITIKRGDTLWDLAGYYYHESALWPEFKSYNFFTDPHWIYPNEKLAIGRKEAMKMVDMLHHKVSSLEDEERMKITHLEGLETEIGRLKQESEVLATHAMGKERDLIELKNLISSKEEELFVLQNDISKTKEENDMLRSAILELQIKLIETDATINSQKQEIARLVRQKQIVSNTGYFLGFAIISTLLAIDTVK